LSVFKDKRWVCDLESNGLLWDATRLWCLTAINLDSPDERLFFGPDEVNNAIRDLFKEARLTVWHNGIAYDCPLVERLLGITVDRTKVRDTLVMSRLANSAREIPPGAKSPHSIDAFARRFGLFKPVHEDWSVFSDNMRVRCTEDTYIGYLTLKKVLQELRGFSPESIANEHELSFILSDMHKEGFYLDQEKAMSLYVETKSKADRIQRDIRKVFPPKSHLLREVEPKPTKGGGFSRAQTKCVSDDPDLVGGPFSLIEFREFNLDSPTQRVERLLACGWEPRTYTPAGNPKFDADELTKEDLDAMPDEVRLLGTYLMLRSRERTTSQWLDLVDSNSYVHGQINATGAWSGRMNHRNPNTANIPSALFNDDGTPILGEEGAYGFEMRSCWGADTRTPNQVLVGADLTAIQLRAFAHYTGDRDYISLVSDPSVDMHNVHAEYLGGVKRSGAKRWLYAFLLGAGNPKLGTLLGGDAQMGEEAARLFMEKVPGVATLKQTLIPRWAKQGYLTALDGRRIPVMSKHLALAGALQSFEKCVIAHATVDLVKTELPFTLRAIVHDELVITSDKDVAEEVGTTFVTKVKETGIRFGSLCPLTANYAVGMTWADVH
jgi:DNA polymerase-1